MRREMFVLLLISAMSFAALDQSYDQTVARDGSSSITKTMDVALFTTEMEAGAFERIQAVCDTDPGMVCSVEGTRITMTERFMPGAHYSFETDYGLPFITYKMTIKQIPSDTFSRSLDGLLRKAGAVSSTEDAAADPIDLTDTEENLENAGFLRRFKANITYTVNMPTGIGEARAGELRGDVRGQSVTFDVIELMEGGQTVAITGGELNMGYLIIISAAVVLGALALSFFTSKPAKRKR